MSIPAIEEIQQDNLALAVARVLKIANEAAIAKGTVLAKSLVTISEETPPPKRLWRIHYGPRDYVKQRGGDLIVFVDEVAGEVERILQGQ